MSGLQTIIRNSIEKLHDVGDITEQESDEIFSFVYDSSNITALTSWYDKVYNKLSNGKDGNFVSTLPLVCTEPGIKAIISKCLNLLPWYRKVCYARLLAKLLPISKLHSKEELRWRLYVL